MCMRKQIAMAEENSLKRGTINTYSRLPRAIVDQDGLPVKGKKSSTTTFLAKRYQNVPLVTDSLPPLWIADSVILEGMFLIYTTPPLFHKTIEEYTKFLLNRYVTCHYTKLGQLKYTWSLTTLKGLNYPQKW